MTSKLQGITYKISESGDNYLSTHYSRNNESTIFWTNTTLNGYKKIHFRSVNLASGQLTPSAPFELHSGRDTYDPKVFVFNERYTILMITDRPYGGTSDEDTYLQLLEYGVPVGNDRQLLYSSGTYNQRKPSIARVDGDTLIVVWQADLNDSSSTVHARTVTIKNSGSTRLSVSSTLSLKRYSSENEYEPKATSLPNDYFMLSWIRKSSDQDSIFTQVFDSRGRSKKYFSVTSTGNFSIKDLETKTLPNGEVIFSWTETINGHQCIFTKIYDKDGNLVRGKSPIIKADGDDSDQSLGQIVNIEDGTFMMLYLSNAGPNHLAVDHYFVNGTQFGQGCKVVGIANPQGFAYEVKGLLNGVFELTWQDGSPNRNVYWGQSTIYKSCDRSETKTLEATDTITDNITLTDTHSNTHSVGSPTKSANDTLSQSNTHSTSKTNSDSISNSNTHSQNITSSKTLSDSKSKTKTVSYGTNSLTNAATVTESASTTDTNAKTESKLTPSSTDTPEITQSTSISLECNARPQEVHTRLTIISTEFTSHTTLVPNQGYEIVRQGVCSNKSVQSKKCDFLFEIHSGKGLALPNEAEVFKDNRFITDGIVATEPRCINADVTGLEEIPGIKETVRWYEHNPLRVNCVKNSDIKKTVTTETLPGRTNTVTFVASYNKYQAPVKIEAIFTCVDKFGNECVHDALRSAANCVFIQQDHISWQLLNNNREVLLRYTTQATFYRQERTTITTDDGNNKLPPAKVDTTVVLSDTNCADLSSTLSPFAQYQNHNNKKYGSIEADIKVKPGQSQICTGIDGLHNLANITGNSNIHSMDVLIQCKDDDVKCISNPMLSNLSYDSFSTQGAICRSIDVGNSHNSVLVPGQCINTQINATTISSSCTSAARVYFRSALENGEKECGQDLISRAAEAYPGKAMNVNSNDQCSVYFEEASVVFPQTTLGYSSTVTDDCAV